jgi:hypothetical protein
LKDFDEIKELKSGNGVIVEIAYLERKIKYFIEESRPDLIGNNSYDKIVESFKNSFSDARPKYTEFMLNYSKYCNKLYDILNG